MSVQTRFIWEIAEEIREDWTNVSPHAEHYLNAMDDIRLITDNYYADSAKTVVMYFLSNAGGWRGPVAQRVKRELKALCGLR